MATAAGFGEQFGLNFEPIADRNGGEIFFACGYPGLANQSNQDPANACGEAMGGSGASDGKPHPGWPDGDAWPYLVETWGSGDTGYWHQIIGDPDLGWVQEVYIHGPGQNVGSTQGGIRSPSDGKNDGRFQPLAHESETPAMTGNGTGNPTMIAIRQYINDTDANGTNMELNFVKDKFDVSGNYKRFLYKPQITQTVTVPGQLRTEFDVDMSNSKYTEDNKAPQKFVMRQYNLDMANPANPVPPETYERSPFMSQLTIEPLSGSPAFLFDPTTAPPPPAPGLPPVLPTQDVRVTAGKYLWTGGLTASGGYGDVYVYSGGAGFNVLTVPWRKFWEGNCPEWCADDPYP